MSLRTHDLLDAVHWVANDQDGMITASQLEAIGVPRSTLSRRIRTGGRWRRVLPGTYCITDGEVTTEQRERAGLLFAGSEAMLTGASGLRRWGVEHLPHDPRDADVHTLVPASRHRKSAGFVIVERTRRMPDAHLLGGVPVAPLARRLADAARRITDRRSTRAMVLEAVQRGLVTVDDVETELRAAQRRGTALLHDTVEEARAGVRSAPEAELRQHMMAADAPLTWWNPTLWTPDERFVAMPDAVVVESMTVLEGQSRKYHDTDEQFARTLSRTERYANHGLTVVHIVPGVMRRNPVATVASIVETHRATLRRPAPDLVLRDTRGLRPSQLPRG